MTSTIISNKNNFYTVEYTKAELDLIQKQFLEELEVMLDKVRKRSEIKNG